MEQHSKQMESIMVHKDGQPVYPIILTDSFDDLESSLAFMTLSKKRVCIVADSRVAELYLEQIRGRFARIAGETYAFTFPAGEAHKTLDTVRTLYEFLIRHSFDRNDVLVALGGGVTGDLTGFAAATYLRGIDFIQMPTTLLSQVDSSIGGKTGVDFDAYKNMVGAFYMPRLVYINVSVLKTLSEDQFASGMGEVIKHGCIRSREYFDWLRENRALIRERQQEALLHTVRESCLIKKAVVEEDPTEKGVRACLNFGHTLGHAIEKEKHFTMSHGACVGAGSLAAAWISCRRGLITEEELQALEELLQYFHIPTSITGLDTERILDAVRHDKKMDSGVIKFILLKEVGCAYIDRTVTAEEMRRSLEWLGRNVHGTKIEKA